MKKVILTTMAIVISLATVLSITGFAVAQTEPMPEEVVVERIGLTINAPAVAKAGQPLRIQVVTNPGGRPVEGAEVWGVKIDSLATDTAVTSDIASISQGNGFLLGTTGDDGYITPPPQIGREGRYVLVAIKQPFSPGFTLMKITQRVPLTLRAPDSARVGQPVPMRVTDPDGQGVYRAAIFAVPLLSLTDASITNSNYQQLIKEAEAYAQMLERPTADGSLPDDEIYDDNTLNIRRYLIGFTDRNGDFSCRFPQAGPYLLIAAKCGYTPDFHIIKITKLEPLPAELAPMSVQEVEEATISLKK